MNQVWTDMMAAAGQGAAIGSVVPGVGTAIGAAAGGLLGVALNVAPGLLPFATQGSKVAQDAAAVVKAITGATTRDDAETALAGNPDLYVQLQSKLAEIASEELSTRLADVQDARTSTLALAQAGSAISWGAPVVSVLAVLAFSGAIVVVLMRAVPDGSQALANVLLGALAASFGQVINYWLGSSAGSASKDGRIAQMVPASLLPRPAAIVPVDAVK